MNKWEWEKPETGPGEGFHMERVRVAWSEQHQLWAAFTDSLDGRPIFAQTKEDAVHFAIHIVLGMRCRERHQKE